MKVLFILTYYYPHWTGLTKYAQRLAEGLAKKKYKVNVLSIKHEKNLKDKEIHNGVQIRRKPIFFRLSRTLISINLLLSISKEISKNDVVFVYLPFAEVFLVAILCRLFHKKLYLVHNGDLVLPKGLLNRLIEKCYYYSTYWSIKLCTSIIIQTKDYGKSSKLLRNLSEKWKVILPLYQTFKQDKLEDGVFKGQLPSEKNVSIIGFAGRFVEEKGFDILIQAISEVVSKKADACFVYAGETKISYENFYDENKTLIEQNKNYLLFLGRLDEKDMVSFLKKCDLLVISSRSDCYPSVGVEAMLVGTPLVVTDIPGVREQVKKTGMGLVVKPNSPKALAEGILKVLKYKHKYTNVQTIKKVKRLYDHEKTLKQYQEIIG